jgi:hypothetical protein
VPKPLSRTVLSMRTTLARHLTVALAVAAATAPAASAQDLRSPDTRDAAREVHGPVQDLRMPDRRDPGTERAVTTVPVVKFIKAPATRSFDWEDAGLGAAGAIGVVLVGIGTLTIARTRRRPTPA